MRLSVLSFLELYSCHYVYCLYPVVGSCLAGEQVSKVSTVKHLTQLEIERMYDNRPWAWFLHSWFSSDESSDFNPLQNVRLRYEIIFSILIFCSTVDIICDREKRKLARKSELTMVFSILHEKSQLRQVLTEKINLGNFCRTDETEDAYTFVIS